MNVSENKTVSVIIPAYNAAETLEKACLSVLTQDYGDVELVVVNDGSADATGQILARLQKDHANLVVVDQENGGVCKARNAGLDRASGGYVAFLDADDEMLPGALTLLQGLLRDRKCDIAAGNFLRQYPGKECSGAAYQYGGRELIWRELDALEHCLKDHPATYTVWGKLYRREAVDNSRFVVGRKIHEDSFFIFELYMRRPSVVVTEEPVTRHYMTAQSASRTAFSDKFLDMLYFARRKYDIIGTEYPQFLPLARNVLVKASLALLNVMRSTQDPKYRDAQKECISIVHENAAYFVPAISRDLRMFRIVRWHLYGAYKLAFRVYRKLR